MLKKRIMSVVLAAMLAVGGSAFACDGVVATGVVAAAPFANDFDIDYDVNDVASAGGSLQVETTVTTYASGDTFAGQAAEAGGYADVDAYANNWDNGLSSGAYAEASFNGSTYGAGLAFSGFRGDAKVIVDSSFSGVVEQAQLTQEINYQNGQGISAYNTSKAEFSGVSIDMDKDSGWFPTAAERESISTRGTEVTGQSFVTIDPTGNYRSYEGMTTSDARIGTSNAEYETSRVSGNGSITGLVQKPAAGYASGTATYAFTGQNAGVGQAQISGNVQDYGSYSTAYSAGSSFVVAD